MDCVRDGWSTGLNEHHTAFCYTHAHTSSRVLRLQELAPTRRLCFASVCCLFVGRSVSRVCSKSEGRIIKTFPYRVGVRIRNKRSDLGAGDGG